MISFFVNTVVALVSLLTIRNFSLGFFAILCTRLIFPVYVRFSIGAASLAVNDFFLIVLAISFIWHKAFITENLTGTKIDRKLFIYMIFSYLTTFLLILFSAQEMPFDMQLSAFGKMLLQDGLYTFFAFHAFKRMDVKFVKYLFIIYAVIGLYGIFVYFFKMNPYISLLSTKFMGENRFDFFLEMNRGGLAGRSSGTLDHPLAWGQVCDIILALLIIYRKLITKKILWFALVGITLVNIIFCGSRSALVSMIFIFIFFVYSVGRKRALIYFVVVLFVFAILSIPLRNVPLFSDVASYIDSSIFFFDESHGEKNNMGGSNVSMREEQLDNALTIASNNPIGGVGFGSVNYFGSDYFVGMRGFESIVFRKIVEQGILGFLFYCVGLVIFMNWIFRYVPKSEKIVWYGYFISYYISIVMTGIQNTWAIFFSLAFLPIVKNSCLINDKKNA